jgi:hypothetical protein
MENAQFRDPHQRPNLVIDQDGFTQFTRRNNQIHQAPDGRNQASKAKKPDEQKYQLVMVGSQVLVGPLSFSS